ncbi:MAG: hypothetical protein K0B07_00910 [DPANN group archaeon]|nr:hypothetical protein [DPANN group archaeon]
MPLEFKKLLMQNPCAGCGATCDNANANKEKAFLKDFYIYDPETGQYATVLETPYDLIATIHSLESIYSQGHSVKNLHILYGNVNGVKNLFLGNGHDVVVNDLSEVNPRDNDTMLMLLHKKRKSSDGRDILENYIEFMDTIQATGSVDAPYTFTAKSMSQKYLTQIEEAISGVPYLKTGDGTNMIINVRKSDLICAKDDGFLDEKLYRDIISDTSKVAPLFPFNFKIKFPEPLKLDLVPARDIPSGIDLTNVSLIDVNDGGTVYHVFFNTSSEHFGRVDIVSGTKYVSVINTYLSDTLKDSDVGPLFAIIKAFDMFENSLSSEHFN